MDREEVRLAALHYFRESSDHPPVSADEWAAVKRYEAFILDGSIPVIEVAQVRSSQRTN